MRRNEALHRLTQEHNQIAVFVIEDWNGVEKYAQYNNFKVSSEKDKYRLTATGYSGTAGDSLYSHNGQQFSTKDNDNDEKRDGSCSEEYEWTGFWFHQCLSSNINGMYLMGGVTTPNALVWYSFSGQFRPMRKSRMMLRPSP
ncbi:fibrinogen-like protein 1 [Pecten maximus]|uniref:fibrinogen-like protein 1 n=1 Tax=Pecten maximus TaxID=6579 RepID=UPI001458F906|nr:fibrinogen-like protein 1 [Pecten maximus]